MVDHGKEAYPKGGGSVPAARLSTPVAPKHGDSYCSGFCAEVTYGTLAARPGGW